MVNGDHIPMDQLEKLCKLAVKSERTPNLAIFIGREGGHFIDNVKYAFLHCVKHAPKLDCYFLTRHQKVVKAMRYHNLPVLFLEDQNCINTLMRVGMVVSDDFWWKSDPLLYSCLFPAKSIQLWHGIPLKAIGMPEIESTVNMNPEKAEHLRFCYSGYDAVSSTSPYFTETAFGRAFQAKDFPETGYPRNDVLTRRHNKLDMINVEQSLYAELVARRKQGTKVVFYMPTFRDTGNTPFGDLAITSPRLEAFCRKSNVLFVIKLHPFLTESAADLPSSVRLANSKSDAYPLLSLCDLLVTDYSSIYFDYLLLDRPILFFPYDYEDYVTKNRELLYDFDEMTPGPKVMNEDELYLAIDEALFKGEDPGKDDRARLRELSFTHPDGKAGARVADYLVTTFI